MIRLARLSDIPALLGLCQNFYDASEYHFPIDLEYAKRFLNFHIQAQDSISLILEDSQNNQIGCLLACATNHLFLPIRIANELIWWVEPNYRGAKSLELLDAFEYWAKEIQKCNIVCVVSTEDKRLENLYKRRKYTVKEHTWYRDL